MKSLEKQRLIVACQSRNVCFPGKKLFFLFATQCIVGVALAGCAMAPASKSDSDQLTLTGIIHEIERGWETADGAVFREHFLDFEGARYIEGGGQNAGLSDLIDRHVLPEADAFKGFELTFSNIEVHMEEKFAWAIADTDIRATLKRDHQRIHYSGYETFLFREIDGKWRVVHTHSSSRPVKEESNDHKH